MWQRRAWAVCGLAVAGALAAGCSGESRPAADEPVETQATDETTPTPTPSPVAPGVFTCIAVDETALTQLSEEERSARRLLNCTPISVRGRIVSREGKAVANARVVVESREAFTDATGQFDLTQLQRRNAMLRVEADGFRPQVLPLALRRPVIETEVQLAPLALSTQEVGSTRMLFSGDVALGRRFLDPTGTVPRDQMPPDHPDALIRVSDPEAGTRAVFEHVRPYFQAADLRAINLETPVTDAPVTPHETKDFAFFTLPGSLPAMRWLGVDYVSLGNNHTFDYLEQGLEDTLRHVDAAGLARSGAGANADAAFAPWRTEHAGVGYSFVSMCSITGDVHDENYVASETKGGAADLRDDARITATFQSERAAGRIPVALLHAGNEYSDSPGGYAADRMRFVVDQGAALVIAHHPHTPQGLAWHKGTLIAQSLGNFAFDQDRLETMLGLLTEVDFQDGRVSDARLLPIYLEDYRPRPVAGALAEGLLRRLAETSRESGVALVPENAAGLVLPEGVEATAQERTVDVQVTVGPRGWAAVDLRSLRQEGESVGEVRVTSSAGANLRAGFDVLQHGDFEDHDVDGDLDEVTRWDLGGGASHVCHAAPDRGVAALCQRRTSGDLGETVVSLRNRLRAPGFFSGHPNRRLTLVGSARGDGSGPVRIVSRFYASEGDAEFGERNTWKHAGGTFGWTPFAEDVRLPAEPTDANAWNAPWALRLFIHHAPPKSGAGLASFDDLAVVAWDAALQPSLTLATPNARDFIRVEAVEGVHSLRVTLRKHEAPGR